MGDPIILHPQYSMPITIKTMTGKTFQMNSQTSNNRRRICDVKYWITNNHGIAADYQELFDQASGKKMDNMDIVSSKNTNLNLVIKPMPKFELVTYCYAFFKINAASTWTVKYLYKALAELHEYPSAEHISIELLRPRQNVELLERSSRKTLSFENIDTTCTIKVYRMLFIEVTHKTGGKEFKIVRINNKYETVKDLLEQLQKRLKMKPKSKLRCKGQILPSEMLLIDLNFELLQVN